MSGEANLSIAELAERAGVSRRTVRYYVELGLVPPPLGRGRGEHYDGRHLAAVLRVKALQLEGHTLAEIRARRRGRAGGPASLVVADAAPAWPGPAGSGTGEVWIRQQLLPGVELHLRRARPLTERQLLALARIVSEMLIEEGGAS